jgi:thiol:disulfide interchange protein DsbD
MKAFAFRLRTSPAISAGICLLLFATVLPASAATIPHGTLELVAENQWVSPGHELTLGLHFQLEKGWHIYWVNPGDSGQPPRVTWQLPAGLTAGAIEWPTPGRLGTSSVVDFGYSDEVMLLVPVRASVGVAVQPAARLGAEVKVLVCREICIPGKAQLTLTIPVKAQPPMPDARTHELFAATRKALPRPLPAGWRISVDDAKDAFVLTANLGRQTTQAIFFPLAEAQIDYAAPQKLVPAATGFQLTLRKSDRLLKPIQRLKGVLVLSADRAYTIDAPLGKPHSAKDRNGIRSFESFEEATQ